MPSITNGEVALKLAVAGKYCPGCVLCGVVRWVYGPCVWSHGIRFPAGVLENGAILLLGVILCVL